MLTAREVTDRRQHFDNEALGLETEVTAMLDQLDAGDPAGALGRLQLLRERFSRLYDAVGRMEALIREAIEAQQEG